jgi:hypothetical protein
MNRTGSYFLSKFKNSCATTFNPKKSERFKYSSNKVPGPGAYDLSLKIPELSREKLSTFSPQDRLHEFLKYYNNNSAPGPGNYKLPSEFGHYIAKDVLIEKDQHIDKLIAVKGTESKL